MHLRTLLPLSAALLLGTGAQAQSSTAPDAYRADTDSGAVTFRVGEVFHGPGPITIGYLGAKKQLLLPNGDWRVLAAVDYRSDHTSPMPLTAAAFGRFEGGRLRSLLVSVSTRRPGRNSNTWASLTHCQADTGGSLWQAAQERFPLSQCARVQALAPARLRDHVPPALVEALDRELPALGATWPSVNLKTSLVVTDRLAALLAVQRYDCVAAPGASGDTCAPLPRGSRDHPSPALQTRLAWAQAYTALAPRGMVKDLPGDELEAADPGNRSAATATAALSLPD